MALPASKITQLDVSVNNIKDIVLYVLLDQQALKHELSARVDVV